MVRFILLILLLGGLGWWLAQEQTRGRFQAVDRVFLDIMLANARERFVPKEGADNRVVFLPIREEDRAEYATWPPDPVDYGMILKGAALFSPSVIILTDTLHWSAADPASVRQLADTLLPLSGVVVTARESAAPSPDADVTWVRERLGTLPAEVEDPFNVEKVSSLAAPAVELARSADMSLLGPLSEGGTKVATEWEGRVCPTPATLGLVHATGSTLGGSLLRLGGGSALHVGQNHFVPLEPDGSLQVSASPLFAEQNALDLMTAGMLADDNSDLAKQLGQGKVLVLGIDSTTDQRARQQAQALAHMLALPNVNILTPTAQVATWAGAGLLSLTLLWVPRRKVLRRALLWLLLAGTASFVVFAAATVWFPPAIPAALVLAAGLFLRIFGPHAKPHE
jgi:hypothetical protein